MKKLVYLFVFLICLINVNAIFQIDSDEVEEKTKIIEDSEGNYTSIPFYECKEEPCNILEDGSYPLWQDVKEDNVTFYAYTPNKSIAGYQFVLFFDNEIYRIDKIEKPDNSNISSLMFNIVNENQLRIIRVSFSDERDVFQEANEIFRVYYTNLSKENVTEDKDIDYIPISNDTNKANLTFDKAKTEIEFNFKDLTEIMETVPIAVTKKESVNMDIVEDSSFRKIDKYIEIDSELGNYNFDAILKVFYEDSDISSGIDESSLRLYYYNEGSGDWEQLEGGVNIEESYVYGNTSHFSLFGIFGKEIATEHPRTISSGDTRSRARTKKTEEVVITKIADECALDSDCGEGFYCRRINEQGLYYRNICEKEVLLEKETFTEEIPTEKQGLNEITGQVVAEQGKGKIRYLTIIFAVILVVMVGVYLLFKRKV